MSKKITISFIVCCLLNSFTITKGQQTFVKYIKARYSFSSAFVDTNYYSNSAWGAGFVKYGNQNNVIAEKAYKGYDINGFEMESRLMYSVKENGQNYFLLTGRTNNWVNDTSLFNYPYTKYSSFVIKVNDTGDTLWSMLYEVGNNVKFCLADDSNYIFTQSAVGGLIIKVNRNTGDTIWTKRYRYDVGVYTFAYYYFGGIVNNGTGFTIAGQMYPTDHPQMMLSRTDTTGNLIWCKTYGDTANNVNWGMTMTHDNGYVLIGQSAKDFADSYPWTNFMLVRTDANGDTLWCRTYDYNNGVEVPSGIVETDDYGFAVAGYSSQMDSMGNWRNYSIMIKVDSMGNVVWANKYGEYDGVPNSLYKTADGFLFTDGLMHQTDSNGVDCSSQPINVTMHYPVMTLTDSTPFQVTSIPVSLQSFYYFHPPLQYDTIVASVKDNCINTGVAEQQVNENDLLLYPNPVSDKLSVSIPISVGSQLTNSALLTVTIYDVLGKQKLQQPFAAYDGKLSLDVGDLSSGIYFISVEQKGKVLNAKFAKE